MYWGHMSVLDADLICLRELRARNKHWQHAATLAGTGEIFIFAVIGRFGQNHPLHCFRLEDLGQVVSGQISFGN